MNEGQGVVIPTRGDRLMSLTYGCVIVLFREMSALFSRSMWVLFTWNCFIYLVDFIYVNCELPTVIAISFIWLITVV